MKQQKLVLSCIVTLLAWGTFASAQTQSVSILGKNVPLERIRTAYEKVRKKYVMGDTMRTPVTESAYVKAWDEYKRRKAAEEREREQARRQAYENYRRGNQNTYRSTTKRSGSVKISAGTDGLNIRDENKPEFKEITGKVVRPGRDAIVAIGEGEYALIRSKSVLTVTGNEIFLLAKRDPKRAEHRMRTANGELTMPIYEDFTLSAQEFMSLLRKGMEFSELPEVRRPRGAANLGKTSQPMSTNSGFGSRTKSSFGSGGSLNKKDSGGLSNRTGSGFAPTRRTEIKR